MQINRLFEIIYLLMDKKRVTAKELAERFEVTPRTIYRDIETLSSAGIPIYMSKGKGGGISILDHFILNKTVLTEEERSNVLTSMKALAEVNFDSSNTALDKLSSLFGGEQSDWIEVDFSSWYQGNKESLLFKDIKSAILSKKQIIFTYVSGKGEKTSRTVEPLKLCFKGMSRYLYGYCTLRRDFRFFKLSRIRDLIITEKHFTRVVQGSVFHNRDSHFDKTMTIKLKFSKNMAYRVYDEFEEYEKDKDGCFIVNIEVPFRTGKNALEDAWIYPYIASFGSQCEVLEPPHIREAIREELQKNLKQYL